MYEFKHYDKIIIVAPPSTSPEDVSYIDGAVGIYLRKANDNESVVSLDDEDRGICAVETVANKYIKFYDKWINRRKRRDSMNENHEENGAKENVISKLQEILGIEDDEKFYLNNDLPCKCYFKNRELRLINKDTNKVFEDENLRNKVFYGLATGTIKPIIEKLTRVPELNDKYYYWDTHYAEDDEDQDYPVVNFDFWRGSINDYMCYYTGNCFASREACAKNYSVIQRLKNRVLQSNMDKFNGKKGLCTAIGERTYVNIKVDNEYIFLPEKFVTLYEKAQEEESNIIPDDKIRIFKEDKKGENFVTKLQNSLGIKDKEIFIVDKNNFMCYFEHGEFFLVNPETHEKISDNALRGKIFYGLANGTISRLTINTPFPKYAEAYYFWETNYISTTEPLQINRRIWKNRLEDYIRFIAGNCFPTKEACKNNISTVELIKNKAFLKQYGKD